jgi:hypothetical protein
VAIQGTSALSRHMRDHHLVPETLVAHRFKRKRHGHAMEPNSSLGTRYYPMNLRPTPTHADLSDPFQIPLIRYASSTGSFAGDQSTDHTPSYGFRTGFPEIPTSLDSQPILDNPRRSPPSSAAEPPPTSLPNHSDCTRPSQFLQDHPIYRSTASSATHLSAGLLRPTGLE